MMGKRLKLVHGVLFALCASFFILLQEEVSAEVETVTVKLAAAAGMTTIDDGSSILFVNYRKARMTRWLKSTGSCTGYDISLGQKEDEQLRDRITLFGEMKRLPDENDSSYPIRLMVAPKAMLTRTVITPKLVWHDFVLAPGFLEFRLAEDQGMFEQLSGITQENKKFSTVKLVSRYDIISLLSLLKGVPAAGRWHQTLFSYTFTLTSYEEQQGRMAEICGSNL